MDEDADGESDDEFEKIVPRAVHVQKEEEEEEEEEGIVIAAKSPSPTPPPAKSKRVRSDNAPAKTRTSEVHKSNPPGRSKGTTKRVPAAAAFEEAEEEDLEFGQPTQTKRSRPSPPSDRLALPGSSSVVQAPGAYPSHSKSHLQPISPSGAPSDSEEDWDEVKPVGVVADDVDAEGEDEEEIDMNLFEAELNEHLGEGSDDDFLAAAVSPEAETMEPLNGGGRPMSLNQFAAGRGEGSQEEDEYSSSEESDYD